MKLMQPIYLDAFATTPLAPEALDAMVKAWSAPGNAGSPHVMGEKAAEIISQARESVARLIGSAPSEIFFTSGATESNNLALIGLAEWALAGGNPRRQIIVSAVEHKAVLEPARALLVKGFEVVVAPVDDQGVINLTGLSELICSNTLLVSVMAANNETGAVQPIRDVSAIARAAGAYFHCDAAQAIGKIVVDVSTIDIDYLSMSAHKFYGPVGVGALYISASAPRPHPVYLGGGQQGGRRPGTEPVPLIAGLAAATDLAVEQMAADSTHGRRLAERLKTRLFERQVRFAVVTGEAEVLPGSLSLKIPGIDGDDLVWSIGKNVCISTGSACTSGQVMTSHVFEAMGYEQEEARSVIRIFINRYTTDADIDAASSIIAEACFRLRQRTGRPVQ